MNYFFRKWVAIYERIRKFLSWGRRQDCVAPQHNQGNLSNPIRLTRPARSRVNAKIRRFRADILDCLDDYFFYIKRMKAGDPIGYSVMTKTGGALWAESPRIGQGSMFLEQTLEPIWQESRPAFHYAFFPIKPQTEKDDRIYPVVASFNKVDGGGGVQPAPKKDIYQVCLVYDRKNDDKIKRPVFLQYYVSIERRGAGVALLKSMIDCPVHIVKRTGPKQARGATAIPRRKWGYPPALNAIAKDNGQTVEEWALGFFCIIANGSAFLGNNTISVAAEKNGIRANFSVDPTEAKVFFEDRDKIITESGRSDRIFHSVRAHNRSDGSAVRLHFRGVRHFKWNGYKINIHIPGRDMRRLFDFSATLHAEESPAIKNIKTVDIREFASELAKTAA